MSAITDRYHSELQRLLSLVQDPAVADPFTAAFAEGRRAGLAAAQSMAEALGSDALPSVQIEGLEWVFKDARSLATTAEQDADRAPDVEALQVIAERARAYVDALEEALGVLEAVFGLESAQTLEELSDVMALLNGRDQRSAADLFEVLSSDEARRLPRRDAELEQIVNPLWGEEPPLPADLAGYLFSWQAARERPQDIAQALAAIRRPSLSLVGTPVGRRQRLSPLAQQPDAPELSL